MKTILFIDNDQLDEHKCAFLEELQEGLTHEDYEPLFTDELLIAANMLKSNPRICAIVIRLESF